MTHDEHGGRTWVQQQQVQVQVQAENALFAGPVMPEQGHGQGLLNSMHKGP